MKLAGLLLSLDKGSVVVDAPNLDGGDLNTEVLGYTLNGSAGTDAHHKVGDAALGLLPDFGSG